MGKTILPDDALPPEGIYNHVNICWQLSMLGRSLEVMHLRQGNLQRHRTAESKLYSHAIEANHHRVRRSIENAALLVEELAASSQC